MAGPARWRRPSAAGPPRRVAERDGQAGGTAQPVARRQTAAAGPGDTAAARSGRLRALRSAAIEWLRREAVFAAVLAGVTLGLLLVSQDRWRRGLLTVGVTLVLAGIARMTVPGRRIGLLAVRGRVFDTVLLLVLGGSVIALTSAVPYIGR
ncbi:conserved membrane hypothetical protein [Frankia canadensis]|uniref:DUF3017 domain-containing protein n=1 Tax=Frankia canadensis TaxID=1836972 RepID=A0A2I2KQH5_9ACTN|nr:DUF3017 domain-containing protein [Frankia canadensis]SNQ47923.1 conserved membrane hypothetical protein [Frankia canadensis]SOU55213.1 conserved membrane hypothetical protein [Frankia canadensis]